MLDNLIVIDYADGAGGEYFSNFISSHSGFYAHTPLNENMQQSSDSVQKYFNSNSLIIKDWDTNFNVYLQKFLTLAKNHSNNICVPYHLYKWPHHTDMFNNVAKTVRFVKIVTDDDNFKYDFFRKVLLKPVTKENFSELNFLLTNTNQEQKLQAIQNLKNKKLYWLDVLLIIKGEKINRASRQQLISHMLNTKVVLPTADIEISYDDFFANFDKTKNAYKSLCNQMDITLDYQLADKLIQRNTKNLKDLLEYKEKFTEIFNAL
jgi:hypothetical protein